MNALIQTIAIIALPVLLAITLHEAAHAYAARFFGDPTAWELGRVSLNPLRHIDPIGTIALPLIFLASGGILFGWAKPVPVDFRRLCNPKRDMLWVAAAGPAANLIMLLFWAALLKLHWLLPAGDFSRPMARMAEAGIGINIILMVLNLFPLPPLDGGRILVSLLPNEAARRYARIEPFGLLILIALLLTGILGKLLTPVMALVDALIAALFQLPS
ncbi:MAG: site-2 protease family protein [Betaproteobacteria bacterium]|nr:site-2 protease family protein [Betaproteobacteria bacterium]